MSRSLQPGTASNAADAYLTWQDLLAEEAETDVTPGAADTSPDQPATDLWSASGQITLPADVEALLAEKDRLESELKRLSGSGDPRPEDERIKRMYPVKVHTKDSRIEERRLRRHDDHQRLLKQRALEAKLSTAREERRQAESAAELRRRAVERALATVRAEVRRAEAEAERRRKAIERAQAALREQARQAEYAAEQERKALETAAVQRRWEHDRQKALQKRAQERRQESLWQEQVLDEQRARALQLARVRRVEEQADLDKRPRDGLSGRSRPLTSEAKRVEADDPMDARYSRSGHARSDPRRTFEQQRGQAQAWEDRQERLRRQACARRREEQMVADRLDRRGKRVDRYA
jgi:hypothetical protein